MLSNHTSSVLEPSFSNAMPNRWQREVYCKPSRIAASVQPEELSDLISYAEMRKIPILGDLRYPGRTVYTNDYRMKGVFGLHSTAAGEFELQSPQPNIEYGQQLPHITLSPEMEIGVKYSSKRSLYSLSARGANTEFECMQRMYDSGYALMPKMAGHIMLGSGEAERGLKSNAEEDGAPTGVFFQKTEPGLKFVGEITSFHLVGDNICRDGPDEIFRGYPTLHSCAASSLESLIRNYCDFSERLGFIRAISVGNGILRHVAHQGNFLYSAKDDALYMIDTDSCLIVGISPELSEQNIGSQLVRDLCNDSVRMISTLAQDSYSREYLASLEKDYSPELDPFYKFFKGFVGDRVSSSVLLEQCQFMRSMYISFVTNNRNILDSIAQKRSNAFMAEDFKTQKKMESIWAFCHDELRKFALYVAYNIVNEAKIEGYNLKQIDHGKMIENFTSGVTNFMKEYAAVISRAK